MRLDRHITLRFDATNPRIRASRAHARALALAAAMRRSGPELREASREDLDAILGFARRARSGGGADARRTATILLRELAACAAPAPAPAPVSFHVAEHAGTVVGAGAFGPPGGHRFRHGNAARPARLIALLVDPALAGLGLGSALLAHLERQMALSGHRTVELGAPPERRRFFVRRGYEACVALEGQPALSAEEPVVHLRKDLPHDHFMRWFRWGQR